jgi:mono/diheme cytochrome c family protein
MAEKRTMQNSRFVAIATTLSAALVATIAASAAGPTSPVAPSSPNVSIARGEYIVTTTGCHDCHTPWVMGPNGPGPDMTRALTAFAGPWGVSFTANLTPDKETGLGEWTADQFLATLRTGRHLGKGRPILPPMPAAVYAKMTDDDLRSVFAYLQSLAPVRNKVPAPIEPAEGGR